ncbi:MMPL family transporter [Mycobacterium heckeshornense]|uniref:Membrane protein n=1 Tax=Mycobacterium heckeshornense TaxID=110505 RepID=A0A2G8AZX6_9MYCO|nr:MMPL family transporter [Mycobacterium heckeshornense]KMV22496.1 membrane protein [Mycobacterium heckeshornense]MCV7034575.1 MMPL family transporter [Mycobacterium heckeshornense]PIJ31060.1 MMPL family transporter [Mycobacterium heckeshornense]BCO33825.1 membrane protein [Mycobacterium heckeshornense]
MSAHSADAPTDALRVAGEPIHERLPRWIRRLAVPILLAWVAVTVVLNLVVPQLDVVGQMRTVSMSPKDAPSMIAMKRVGQVFHEFKSDSSAMVVLEGDRPLGDAAHHYYDGLVAKFRADTKHVENVQDFWSDPLTAAGSQSPDGKAAYVQVYLAGNQGESLANESVEAIQTILKNNPPPPGIHVYATGAAPLLADQHIAGDRSLKLITSLTFLVIIVMLLFVYRSIITVLIVMAMVFLELAVARGVVAFLGYHNIIGLSTFAVNLLVMLAIAAATDYAIFLIGRYQEARTVGEDRESAFYTMYRGTGHVILGSGLTIAGATFCLRFTRLPYFQTLGVPLAIGMLVVVFAALTLGAAAVVVASHFGLLEPRRAMRIRGWRKIGAAVVRWPAPVLAATVAIALVGLITLPSYRPGYDNRNYMPADIPANVGYAAADRHFAQARMNPELLLIETDHDMRNPADFLVINRVAKAVFQVPGIARVQAITRPQGTPINHTTIPFMISMQGTTQQLNMKYMLDRMNDMLVQADEMQKTINNMEKMLDITRQMADTTHSMVGKMHGMVADIQELRDQIANFDDFWRPIRSYFYWEKHCFDIPICWSLRSIFDALDGVDTMTDDITNLMPDMDRLDTLMPQMLTIMPPMIETMKTMKTMMLTMQQTMGGLQHQMQAMMDNQSAMGHAFDDAKNDDSFYLPPEAFDNPDFKRGVKMFLSPDGHAVRMIIFHEGDPMSPEGISHVTPIKRAVHEAIKATPLEGSKVYLGGTAAIYKDMSTGATWDLIIAGIASLCLIFIVMLVITRSIIAAAVIVGTVLLSLGSAFGLSVLIWQHIVGLDVHWMVLAMSVIILLAVGSDYNLLLVARFKEEIHAGLKTGIIRAMGGSGSVVTSAGLVFAFTMMAMVVSDLRVIGQVGTTIGLGLLFDTLVVRSFMTPSIAALLGRWFWWPQRVRTRPARHRAAPTAPVSRELAEARS